VKKQVRGNEKPAILADSVEALIAAIYLDSNLENCEKFIISNLKKQIEEESKNVGMKDYKTVLQEELQKQGNIKIEYNIIKEIGPDHNKEFLSEVRVESKQIGTGKGKTKKEAQTNAAKNTLEKLNRKKKE
jgi:ribonuclease-3